jgi:hypothetical protein
MVGLNNRPLCLWLYDIMLLISSSRASFDGRRGGYGGECNCC